jgi:succinate dehydrogenase flavin-adding protein (antitoxin of CptAB toxin-antitoxin module)
MEQYKNKTLEELLEIRYQLVQAWVIQKSDYQEKQLKKVNREIEKRKKNEKENN